MLLAVDIGNTSTLIGVFEGEALVAHWRIASDADRSADECAVVLKQLFELRQETYPIRAAALCSVVPGATQPMVDALRTWLDVGTLVVGPGVKSGMPILYESPKQVGADRIVNAVAAYARVGGGVIVVDFGTATTFDCITPRGEYLGGVIAPGIGISADALYTHAAQLPRVEIRKPETVIGRNTVNSMEAGLYYGYVGLVDGIVRKMMGELDFSVRVIATGGLAPLFEDGAEVIEEIDVFLTLKGLRILSQRNAKT